MKLIIFWNQKIKYGSIVNTNKNLGNPNKKKWKWVIQTIKMGNPNNFLDYFLDQRIFWTIFAQCT